MVHPSGFLPGLDLLDFRESATWHYGPSPLQILLNFASEVSSLRFSYSAPICPSLAPASSGSWSQGWTFPLSRASPLAFSFSCLISFITFLHLLARDLVLYLQLWLLSLVLVEVSKCLLDISASTRKFTRCKPECIFSPGIPLCFVFLAMEPLFCCHSRYFLFFCK